MRTFDEQRKGRKKHTGKGRAAQLASKEMGAAESKRTMAWMRKRFGTIPTSVLRIARGQLSKRVYNYQREHEKTGIDVVPRDARAKSASVGVSGRCKGQTGESFSIMPAELVAFFIDYYRDAFDDRDGIYFDPFAGQGIQLQVAKMKGMGYVGYDICEKFVRYIESVIERIDDGATTLEVHHRSSTDVHLDDCSADFSFTSPPYWDLELYDEHPEQLGVGKSYDEFLDGMERVYRELHRVLKPGSFAVVNVGNIRRDGRLLDYCGDTVRRACAAGFVFHDEWVLYGNVVGMSKAFPVQRMLRHTSPRVHEYALVFRKALS